jgi:hypothetical protein
MGPSLALTLLLAALAEYRKYGRSLRSLWRTIRAHRTTLQTQQKIGRSKHTERHSTTMELRIGRNDVKLVSSKELGCVSSRRPLISPGHAARGALYRHFKHTGQLWNPSELRWRPVQANLCPAQTPTGAHAGEVRTADYQVRVEA